MEYKYIKRWTLPQHYFGAVWPNHYSAGVGRSRNSDCLEESNFQVMLDKLGGESDIVTVVRESHFLVGWVEWIAIEDDGTDESRRLLQIADRQCERLQDYPVLDENDLCERETDAANDVWRDCYDWQERIEYIRKNRSQFEFHNYSDMLDCVRGKYFAGYASELIG